MGIFNRAAGESGGEDVRGRWLTPWAGLEAVFDQAEFVDGYAVLRWETDRGGVGLAHSLIDGNASPQMVLRALRLRHGEHTAGQYACVVVAQAGTQVSEPYVPKLIACDLNGDGKQYESTWRQLAAVLGQPAPYWFPALRDRDTIAAWRPGAAPAVCRPAM
ncbi:hypothetical protein [Streptomyces sp. N2A]|uniref:hypothetical protein n=1 Tax=Streptomyces sp. N2A TaxID=3073936 RepID=UPI0028706560|nr:hypothetical protein [Streptomyces sp. N2A]